jgi:xanthine dehydrogenase large subunit
MDAPVNPAQALGEAAVGRPLPHDSAALHVTGRAGYTDDLPEPRDLLHVAVGMSRHAHARIRSLGLGRVIAAPGVVDVLRAEDIPGRNNFGPIVADDPILVADEALYAGHPLFAVAARDVEAARRAARLADVDY